MPELPEVETVRAGLAPILVGARLAKIELRRPGLRFAFPPDFAETLADRTVTSVNRRAKYLLIELAAGPLWLVHLGMTGNFRLADLVTPAGAHDHVLIHLDRPAKGPGQLVYSDPRRFGFMSLVSDPTTDPHLAKLGPEPLGNRFTAPDLAAAIAGRRAPIKTLLLDQSVVAGLGNIYVCEALWRAGISPFTAGAVLVRRNGQPRRALDRLVGAIRNVLEEAIAAGGSTLADFRRPDGASGYFQHDFAVYGRQDDPCLKPGCHGVVARRVQSGRSTFYCPRCQRP